MVPPSPTRELDGFLILDKPSGFSSNQCLQQVKRLLGAAKAGHTGSLDPLASGVLPLCFGEATKLSRFLLDADKTYRARLRLGSATTTGDSEGELVATRAVPAFSHEELAATLRRFEGRSTQQPSIYSALKQDGVPLYKLARAGKEIRAKFREVQVYGITMLAWEHPELDIEVRCSKGTYIRTLAEDIGKTLGTGAHLSALRRLQAGPFRLEQSVSLEALREMTPEQREARLLPIDTPLAGLPRVKLDATQTLALRQGKQVSVTVPACEYATVYCAGEFVGIGEVEAGGVLKAVRLLKY